MLAIPKSLIPTSIFIIYLEGTVAIVNGSQKVPPPSSRAVSRSPRTTEHPHDGVTQCGELDIDTGLKRPRRKVLGYKVCDILDHSDVLACVVSVALIIAGPLYRVIHPEKVALVWSAGQVTEVLLEVVVAGGADRLNDLLRCHEVGLEVHQLPLAAAEVLGLAVLVQVGAGLGQDLQHLLGGGLGGPRVVTVQVVDLGRVIASIVWVPAAGVIPYTVTLLISQDVLISPNMLRNDAEK